MSILVIFYSILLFFLLTPGILITLPRKSSKTIVALTHAIVFGIIYHLTHQFVESLEGLTNDEITNAEIYKAQIARQKQEEKLQREQQDKIKQQEKDKRDQVRARREVSDKNSGNGTKRSVAASIDVMNKINYNILHGII